MAVNQKKLGLALGGGGARGLAHIGVLKVLERAGIQVHYLAGTSMGSIVAAAYAAGITPAQMEQDALRLSHKRHLVRLADFGKLSHGLLQGRRVRKMLVEQWKLDKTFDQLSIPVAAVATHLRGQHSTVLRSGSVVDAVMASSAFPSVFPPVLVNGELLCDGFIFNNVPADIVREMGAQVVMAVDVLSTKPLIEEDPAIITQPAEANQGLYQAIMMMVAEATLDNLRASPADLVLRPVIPADLTIFLGFTRAAEAISAGEKAAEAELPKIIEALN